MKNTVWPRNPIDYFVLDRLEREGLAPSREASRETLIRRVSLDLTGLPPTPAEVDAFLQDQSPRCLREGGRSAARLAAIRRADGRALARCRALRRYQRLPVRRRARHVALARLGDRRLQSQPAVRPVHASSRLAGDMLPNATLDQKIATRLQPQPSGEYRRRHHPRGVRGGVRGGPRGDDLHGVSRTDAGLRALPQSQVRSVHAEGVLSGLRLFQQRAGVRPRHEVRQLAAADCGSD